MYDREDLCHPYLYAATLQYCLYWHGILLVHMHCYVNCCDNSTAQSTTFLHSFPGLTHSYREYHHWLYIPPSDCALVQYVNHLRYIPWVNLYTKHYCALIHILLYVALAIEQMCSIDSSK